MTSESKMYKHWASYLEYLQELLERRIRAYLDPSQELVFPPFALVATTGNFSVFADRHKLDVAEQLIVLLALLPHLSPGFIDSIWRKTNPKQQEIPIFGGIRGKNHRGILPTGETALFLLAGNDHDLRLAIQSYLQPDGTLVSAGIIEVLAAPPGEPRLAGQLVLREDFAEKLLFGTNTTPSFSTSFPASQVHTSLDWEDLVLPQRTLRDLAPIRHYLAHHQDLDGRPEFGRHARRGYRALFHGPPGTGKTLTAGLIGKAADRLVFRVDLSMVISKYIGETEKNLAALFQKAENKGWILFFDEADALFGKRTDVKESKDRYANQETSYLLQRVEQYDGLVILATNFKRNMDKAFTRRFESIIHFPAPGAEERLRLWTSMWPAKLPPAPDVDLQQIAERFELTGAAIANLLRHATYETIAKGESQIDYNMILIAIRREYEKEDRIFAK